jgi:hypothetical protein
MARVKRWTVPFMSFNGTSCHVDIFDEDWTGSVTTLIGAANPFEYEEDNDEDLLNGVLRYRSGYLRIVEETYGDLDALYPATNTDRYIEFYYGENLDFVGFIMAQEFDNDWVSGPRIIELPVVSPLGLAAGTTLDWTQFVATGNIPQWLTIRKMINRAFTALNGAYEGFYFPKYHTSQYGDSIVMDKLFLNTLVPVPFGNTYFKAGVSGDLTGIYDPRTVADLLTTICTGFGVILHDGTDYPVFQRVDWEGVYVKFGLSSTATPVEQGLIDLTAIAEVASADNMQSVVQPLSRIEVTLEGEENYEEMTMDRCHGYDRPSALENYELCTNRPNIDDFVGTFGTYISLDQYGRIGEGIVSLAAVGSNSLSEMILYQASTSWEGGRFIASYTFFDWWGDDGRLQFTFKYGESVENMNNPSYPVVPGGENIFSKIAVRIRTGNMVYSRQSGWVTYTGTGYSAVWTDGRDVCEIEFLPYSYSVEPLTVEFYCISAFVGNIHGISDVKILKFESASRNYLYNNENPNHYTVEGTPSFVVGNINRGCGVIAYNTHKVRIDLNGVTGTTEVEIWNNDPRYPYLTQAQDRLIIDVKTESYQQLAQWYMNRQTLWSSSKKWRCIARSFRPWDDVYRLTFHHSPIFDTPERSLSIYPSSVDLLSDGSTSETINVISNTNWTIE